MNYLSDPQDNIREQERTEKSSIYNRSYFAQSNLILLQGKSIQCILHTLREFEWLSQMSHTLLQAVGTIT